MAYKSFAAGYLVKEGKVLLAHSRKYDKWVPPGGHIEENETPDQTCVREFLEETGIQVKALSSVQNNLPGDPARKPIAVPFHMGLYSEDFDVPHIGYFYFVQPIDENYTVVNQREEHFDIGWFSAEEIEALPTYQQVRNEAAYALSNYPKTI